MIRYPTKVKELGILRASYNGFNVMEIREVKYVKQLGEWVRMPCN